MLEREKLFIRDAEADGSRWIEDLESGTRLGTSRPATEGGRWLPFLTVLEVREVGDAPLVFTVRRRWVFLPGRVVRDAEARHVGTVIGSRVQGPGDRRIVLGYDGAFRGDDGRVLARMRREKGGTSLHFSEECAADPFGKMLLLATVLHS
jgi:hypothetical protein